MRVALDLSDSIRAITIAGIQARNPTWSRAEAVRHLVALLHGVVLPVAG